MSWVIVVDQVVVEAVDDTLQVEQEILPLQLQIKVLPEELQKTQQQTQTVEVVEAVQVL